MRLPLTPHGLFEVLVFTVLFGGAGVACILGWPGGAAGAALSLIPFGSLAFVLSFFRDPERQGPDDPQAVVAAADGKVTDILEVTDAPFVNGPAVRVGIFLSVFNVHVNRAPLAGKVTYLKHRPGAYLDAREPACADLNEAQDLGLTVDDGNGATFPVLVRQISGLVARRIVCPVREGRELSRGERYGMIKFGSRTEVYLPRERVESLSVKVGDTVKGGRDVLARVRTGSPVASAETRP